ncbi:MAG: large conductance mechanosensitive channel protein MscL [Patescibacteria group bacterium]|nr:large conductance mechanosensitive channel protein MscL [Patescibacteria group bacterium]
MAQQSFWADFKSFALKGNVMDLAIAVVVGNAFSGVVNSLVGDIITPVIGLLTNNVDLKTLAWQQGPLIIKYGSFLQALFNFVVIALSIFLILRVLSALRERVWRRKQEEVPVHQKPEDVQLLTEIRDLLKERR